MDQKEIMLSFLPLLDCVAPYNIDVWFDKGNDKQNAAGNDYTSCGKYNILKNFIVALRWTFNVPVWELN